MKLKEKLDTIDSLYQFTTCNFNEVLITQIKDLSPWILDSGDFDYKALILFQLRFRFTFNDRSLQGNYRFIKP